MYYNKFHYKCFYINNILSLTLKITTFRKNFILGFYMSRTVKIGKNFKIIYVDAHIMVPQSKFLSILFQLILIINMGVGQYCNRQLNER